MPNHSTGTILISIHAPVKGATLRCNMGKHIPIISIHAPVKGATITDKLYPCSRQISIHAPVKGATLWLPPPRLVPKFQSTLP